MTGKWSIVNDNSKANYGRGNEITYNTKVLKFNLCDYDAYILVTGDTIIIGDNGHGVAFKNCVPLTKCMTNIDGTTIDDAEDLDFVMPMYNLVEYSYNYSETEEVYGCILKMKQSVLILILLMMAILNLSSIIRKHSSIWSK